MKKRDKHRERKVHVEEVQSPYKILETKFGEEYLSHINKYCFIIFGFSLFIYGSTCYRTIPGGDSSELIGTVNSRYFILC